MPWSNFLQCTVFLILSPFGHKSALGAIKLLSVALSLYSTLSPSRIYFEQFHSSIPATHSLCFVVVLPCVLSLSHSLALFDREIWCSKITHSRAVLYTLWIPGFFCQQLLASRTISSYWVSTRRSAFVGCCVLRAGGDKGFEFRYKFNFSVPQKRDKVQTFVQSSSYSWAGLLLQPAVCSPISRACYFVINTYVNGEEHSTRITFCYSTRCIYIAN